MLLTLLVWAAAAQDRPAGVCNFDGFSADPRLAEVTRATVGYFACGSPKGCLTAKASAGDPVTIYRVDGAWTCGYLEQRGGATPAWLKSADIREIHGDPAPALAAWAGNWENGEGSIRITANGGKLHLAGDNVWKGATTTHTGDFEGDAVPNGNHLRFGEGGAGSCTVDLTLFGKAMVANDNEACGGLNVRFRGVWKRGK